GAWGLSWPGRGAADGDGGGEQGARAPIASYAPGSAKDAAGRLERQVDARRAHVEVGDGAHRARAEGAHAHAVSEEALHRRRRVERAGQVEEDEIGLDLARAGLPARQRRQAPREPAP